MTVAVIDGGFLNADAIPLLQNVKIEGTRNFVHPGWDVYAELDHGMSVLSCMAASYCILSSERKLPLRRRYEQMLTASATMSTVVKISLTVSFTYGLTSNR